MDVDTPTNNGVEVSLKVLVETGFSAKWVHGPDTGCPGTGLEIFLMNLYELDSTKTCFLYLTKGRRERYCKIANLTSLTYS